MPTLLLLEDDELEWFIRQCRSQVGAAGLDQSNFHGHLLHVLETRQVSH